MLRPRYSAMAGKQWGRWDDGWLCERGKTGLCVCTIGLRVVWSRFIIWWGQIVHTVEKDSHQFAPSCFHMFSKLLVFSKD